MFVPADLEPEKLSAAAAYGPTIYAVDGNYDHCSRLSVELSFELPWGFVNVNLRSYYAEGSKTLAYEIAEQLGWRAPDVVAIPIASGALFHKVGQGFAELRTLGLVDGVGAEPRRRPGGGVPARRDRVPRGDDGHARAAGHRSRARSRSATRRTATSPSRPRGRPAARSTRSPRTRSARTWRSSRGRRACSARRRPGVTLGALRAAVEAGDVRTRDRVVLLVTGDGLKTPAPVAFTYAPVHIAPDADAFLDTVWRLLGLRRRGYYAAVARRARDQLAPRAAVPGFAWTRAETAREPRSRTSSSASSRSIAPSSSVVLELVRRHPDAEARLVDALRVVGLVPEDRQRDHRLAEVEALGRRVVAAVRDDEVDLREDRRLRQELRAPHVVGELELGVLRPLRHDEPVR